MARDIRSQLPSGAGEYVSTITIRNRLHDVQLREQVSVTGVPLSNHPRARRLASSSYLVHRMASGSVHG
ncbi:hypothetical protein TNCV_1429551 [Trichonephila clavipes]|nr:hypothetical protein TNCV_1429551 [Trichonephila clavipes]